MSRPAAARSAGAGAGAKPTPTTTKARPAKAKKTADSEPAADGGSSKDPPISWAKRPELTWKFVNWLKDFPTERAKLFSDSAAEAKSEQRKKHVAKESKVAQFDRIARYIFEDDPQEAEGFARNPGRYGRSTQQHLQRVKTTYRDHCEALGQTGAGVRPEDVVPGSALHNSVDLIKQTFPWWDDLHAYWQELPNYNPCGVSTSTPGTDHAATAAALFEGDPNDSDEDNPGSESNSGDGTGSVRGAGKEPLAPEAVAEMDADPSADEDSDAGSVTAGGSRADAGSRASSVSRVTDVLARKGESAPARSASARPDLLSRKGEVKAPAAPSSSSSSGSALKHKISGLGKSSVKGRKNLLDGFNETRLAENERLSKKRDLEHTEVMAKLSGERASKRLKLESQERRLREDREFQAAEAARNRAHALQMKQLELQIAMAAAGQQHAGYPRNHNDQVLPLPRAAPFDFGDDPLDLNNPALAYQ